MPERLWDNFVTVTAVVAIGFLAWGFYQLHETGTKADRAARDAKAAAVSNRQQIRDLKRVGRESCLSRHALAGIAIKRLQLDIARTVKFLNGPGRREFGPRTIVAIEAGIAENRGLLEEARKADCVLLNGKPITPEGRG